MLHAFGIVRLYVVGLRSFQFGLKLVVIISLIKSRGVLLGFGETGEILMEKGWLGKSVYLSLSACCHLSPIPTLASPQQQAGVVCDTRVSRFRDGGFLLLPYSNNADPFLDSECSFWCVYTCMDTTIDFGDTSR